MPKLYVAVIDDVIDTAAVQSLEQSTASDLAIPVGRRGGILIDSQFNLSRDGLEKLQTLLSNHEIDVIIASRSAFSELAGYGYFTPMPSALTSSQHRQLSTSIVRFNGYDDSDHEDAFYNGSGHGPEQPYGLELTKLPKWKDLTESTTHSAILGIAQNSKHRSDEQRFISYLAQQ